MLIHQIMKLPYKGANPIKEFGGKSGEKKLGYNMKVEYELIKKSC